MKKKNTPRRLGSPPTIFHPNISCMEYEHGELDFVVQNIFTATVNHKIKAPFQKFVFYCQGANLPIEYKLSPSYYLRDGTESCLERTIEGNRYTEDVAKYVIHAVEWFGIDALRLNANDSASINLAFSKETMVEAFANFQRVGEKFPISSIDSEKHSAPPIRLKLPVKPKGRDPEYSEDTSSGVAELNEKPARRDPLEWLHPTVAAWERIRLQELRFREGLGSAICDVLRFWWEQAQRGALKERRQAVKHLREFGNALIPDTRGKREHTLTATAYELKKFYFKELYRFYHIDNALRLPLPRNQSLKVTETSKNFDLPVARIREFWRWMTTMSQSTADRYRSRKECARSRPKSQNLSRHCL